MTTVTLGKTGITVNKNGFGALPIQRITKEEAAKLLRKAYDGGITYFDTARAYSDSEEKIGYALSDVRTHIYLATKTAATTAEGFWKDLETSLRLLKTDCIDVYQFHNPAVCPKPGDESGLYDAALKAREQGKIRFISITNHRLAVANEAVRDVTVPVLLSLQREGSGACGKVQKGRYGLYCHEGIVRRSDQQFKSRLRVSGTVRQRTSDLGCPEGT